MITPYQKPEDKDAKASNFWTNLAGKLGLSAPLVRQASASEQKVQRISDGIQLHAKKGTPHPIEQMSPAGDGSVETTPEFWDCECPENYIHPASQPTCEICKSAKDSQPDSRVSEVIELLGITPQRRERDGRDYLASRQDGAVVKVSGQKRNSDALLARYAGVFHRAVAELGQSERVKAADRLSRIEEDMAAFKDKLLGLGGGEKAMADLVGEVSAKADSLSGACVQLRNKVDALSMAQAQSIENAFLVLSDAKTEIDKIKGDSGGADMGLAMPMEMGLPMEGGEALEIGEDVSEIPDAPEGEEEDSAPSAIAGYVPAFVKKAADAAYNDLRCIHTKISLVDSMLNALVSELNVSDMLGPSPMSGPGMPPEGMPPMEEMPGEEKAPAPFGSTPDDDSEADRSESGLTAGRKGTTRVAASGDPGDMDAGNTIYKSLDKCRDCVWFESDWTHETYRDKCKHCTHASLGGAIEHFWPRSQQMVMVLPQWSAPEAKAKKAFVGSLSMVQTAKVVSAAALEIAAEIVANAAHTAVDLGTEFVSYFQDPVIARSMPVIAGEIAAEIEKLTGIEIAISASKSQAWGRKADAEGRAYNQCDKPTGEFPNEGKCGKSVKSPATRCEQHPIKKIWPGDEDQSSGEVTIACDTSLVHLAKGEKRKIKELREQLQGEKDATKIKSLNDAIDSLYSRMDSDKERREKSREQREEKRKKAQESADKEPAKFPEPATASFVGTLCLANGPSVDGVPYCDACDSIKPKCKCKPRTAKKSDHEDGGKHDPADDLSHGLGRGQGHTKNFKVVAVSTNTNSFGLHGVIMIAEDGEAWKAAHGQLELPKEGDTLKIDLGAWGASGFEIPEKLPKPPADVIAQVWGKQAGSAGRSLR